MNGRIASPGSERPGSASRESKRPFGRTTNCQTLGPCSEENVNALPGKGLDLFTATPPALGNKRRLFRLYDTTLAGAYGWWILSLPWRLTVYQSVGRHR